jgi:hypothetical protein
LSYGKTPCSYFRGKVSAQPLAVSLKRHQNSKRTK